MTLCRSSQQATLAPGCVQALHMHIYTDKSSNCSRFDFHEHRVAPGLLLAARHLYAAPQKGGGRIAMTASSRLSLASLVVHELAGQRINECCY